MTPETTNKLEKALDAHHGGHIDLKQVFMDGYNARVAEERAVPVSEPPKWHSVCDGLPPMGVVSESGRLASGRVPVLVSGMDKPCLGRLTKSNSTGKVRWLIDSLSGAWSVTHWYDLPAH